MNEDVEMYISLAEIAYKSGNTAKAIVYAESAIESGADYSKSVALRIFTARCLSKLGKYDESNKIYRTLINENNYIPPVIMGLLYNNFKTSEINAKKISRNLGLIKLYVR